MGHNTQKSPNQQASTQKNPVHNRRADLNADTHDETGAFVDKAAQMPPAMHGQPKLIDENGNTEEIKPDGQKG